MRRVICLFLGVIVIYVGLMSTPAFAEQGISITDMENTGNVTVTYRGKGSHHKSGIKIREGAKRGTPGHGGSHHKRSNPHAGKRQPPTSPKLSKSVDRRESDAYIASSILSLASSRIPYLLGLNLSLMEPKPNRTTLSPSPVRPKVSTREEARHWSVDLATNIHLAKPVVYVEPRPSVNKWNITAVGQPLWFHNPGSERHTSSDSSRGIIVSLDATRVETIYNTGEKTVRCAHSTPRPKNADPRAQSPDCGYIYQHPGNYTVRMTEVWQVRWRSGDQSGQIVTRRSSSKPLKVNELIGVLTQPGRR